MIVVEQSSQTARFEIIGALRHSQVEYTKLKKVYTTKDLTEHQQNGDGNLSKMNESPYKTLILMNQFLIHNSI